MTASLARRIQEIPGVAAVAVDLTEAGGGINIRLEPLADEANVLERVRELLGAYGTRPCEEEPRVKVGRANRERAEPERVEETRLMARVPDVDVVITPTEAGARIEVTTGSVRSYRNVAATPRAIAQGLTDAWCQVVGKVPLEIVAVGRDRRGWLAVEATDGVTRSSGAASLAEGWRNALIVAVGLAIGAIEPPEANNNPVDAQASNS